MEDRVALLQQWHRFGGAMLMTHHQIANMLENKSSRTGPPLSETQYNIVKSCLQIPGADVVIVDEAHSMARPKVHVVFGVHAYIEQARITSVMKTVASTRRIALTGSPLQNHLEEYWSMV